MRDRLRIGQVLVDAGLLSGDQLTEALRVQASTGGRLGSVLVSLGYVREDDLLQCLSLQLGVPAVDFRQVSIPPRVLAALPGKLARRHGVVPVALREECGRKTLALAMADPTEVECIREVEFALGLAVRPVVAAAGSLADAVARHYPDPGQDGRSPA